MAKRAEKEDQNDSQDMSPAEKAGIQYSGRRKPAAAAGNQDLPADIPAVKPPKEIHFE